MHNNLPIADCTVVILYRETIPLNLSLVSAIQSYQEDVQQLFLFQAKKL